MLLTTSENLDIEALASPFVGDSPGGDGRAYVRDLRAQFSELRNPDTSSNPNDPEASEATVTPEWEAIISLAIDSLSTKTKDLRIACHLTEALMQTRGLDGLGIGLALIAALLENGWDWVIPKVDLEDAEVRTSPLENLLDDPNRGPRLPMELRALPIVGTGSSKVSLQDATRRGGDEEDRKRVSLALSSCTVEFGSALLKQYRFTTEQLERIQTVCTDKMGSAAPGFANLTESLSVIGQWLKNCFGEMDSDTTEPAPNDEIAVSGEASGKATVSVTTSEPSRFDITETASILRLSMQMRNDAYEQLTKAATVLQQIEPHSPIPYLIHRAVRLGQLPFPDLVGKLVHEEATLESLRGEFDLSVPTD